MNSVVFLILKFSADYVWYATMISGYTMHEMRTIVDEDDALRCGGTVCCEPISKESFMTLAFVIEASSSPGWTVARG